MDKKLTPTYIEQNYKLMPLSKFTKELFNKAKYIVTLGYDVHYGDTANTRKVETCEMEIFSPTESVWKRLWLYKGNWDVVEEGDFGNKPYTFEEVKDRMRLFSSEGFYYIPKENTMKGFKTATYGKKSHRDNITQLENSVRKMF